MGIFKDGIGGAVDGVSHEVGGALGGAVRHEVVGDGTAVIHHRLTEVGELRLTADPIRVAPVALQVPPVIVRVGADALTQLRLRLPADFTLRLSVFGREVARLDLSGAARVEADQDPPVT